MNMLIDVHHHAMTVFYPAAMRKEGTEKIDGFPVPEGSADKSPALIEQAGIGLAILNVSEELFSMVRRHEVSRYRATRA